MKRSKSNFKPDTAVGLKSIYLLQERKEKVQEMQENDQAKGQAQSRALYRVQHHLVARGLCAQNTFSVCRLCCHPSHMS